MSSHPVLDVLPAGATHREVEQLLREQGWTSCGEGDWAIALAAPDAEVVARISPFDPVGPYTARLYREAAGTGLVPRLLAHRRLAGGGDLQILERLTEVPATDAAAFHRRLAAASAASAGPERPEQRPMPTDPGTAPDPAALAELARAVARIHAEARRDLPWCGPLDDNPANVMRTASGTPVLIDPYFAGGPDLYATAEHDPDQLVARIPEPERRYMTEIPLAGSGPWSAADRAALRESIARADARRGSGAHRTSDASPHS
ncbi:hypothetical protein [Brachybacterium phenoliresistens]|uniref:hypothetical protein n=1 Tax=Brachybacterium phenoliresistens TaxID=396014 RepID=UPI0031D082A4